MNNADLIVAILKAAGIGHGFGIPSGNVLPLMEAMRKGGVEFVLTAHEGSAGFAADVSGRLTGAPGLAIATLGPGATNLATGVGSAWLDRSPMIAITCNLNTDQLGRRIQMWIDHHALFKPITKATLRLERGRIADTVSAAIALAMSEPMGPVHLDLPEDVALAPATEAIPPSAGRIALAPAPDAEVARAGELIAAAKRPVAVIGSSAVRAADPSLLRKVVERHNLPFATTTMAKGLIDEEHRLALGCIERGCRQLQRKFLRSADLIVGLGYDTIEVEYEAWIDDVPLLQIDIEPPDVAPSVSLVHHVGGDLGASLARLAALPPATNRWAAQALTDHRRAFQQALRPETNSFSAHAAIDAVRRALPRDGVLSFDVGAHTHQISSQWTAHAPKTFLITNGWSSMGFGLPGAIAAKARAARPARGLPDRRRLLPDDLRRGCDREAPWSHASDRRARRQVARAHQGEADPPAVPALRYGIAGGGLSRSASALFRRACGRGPERRCSGSGGGISAGGARSDCHRSGGRFRALYGDGV